LGVLSKSTTRRRFSNGSGFHGRLAASKTKHAVPLHIVFCGEDDRVSATHSAFHPPFTGLQPSPFSQRQSKGRLT
jgi:hypothetical protein